MHESLLEPVICRKDVEVKFPPMEAAAADLDPSLAWRVFAAFNLLRLLAPLPLGVLFVAMSPAPVGQDHPALFAGATVAYFLHALTSVGNIRRRWPDIPLQALTSVCVDVLLISVLAYASGGVSAGLAALLVLTIGAASSIVRQQLALLFATIAALALLLERGFTMLVANETGGLLIPAVAGALIFAVTLAVRPLARRLWGSQGPAPKAATELPQPSLVEAAEPVAPEEEIMVEEDFGEAPPHEPAQRESIELTAWLKEFVTEFWLANEIDSQTLRLTSPGRDIHVRFDPANLHELLWNLCASAVERAREAGTIGPSEIRIDRHATTLRPFLEVLDRAPRIAATSNARVFDHSFAMSTDRPTHELQIARELAHNNNTVLTYEPRLGGGAILRLVFGDA